MPRSIPPVLRVLPTLKPSHWQAAAWVALVALGLAAGIGMREPMPADEPRFVLSAKAMVESGYWLVPHRGQEFYAEKPAVFMWLQAAAYTLVRDWRIAFLLPSLLAALVTLWLTWDLAARLWSRRIAWHAAGALWVCLQFGLQAKRGQIDMVLVALTTLALWALLRHLLVARSRGLLWLGAFAAGLGTVTKGVGFLPLLVLLPWALLSHRREAALPRTGSALDWLGAGFAFLAGTAVWLGPLLATLALDPDPALESYTRELLFKQTGERYANPWMHVQPWWYYLQVIATLWLPGALLLPWLVPAWWRRLRRMDPRQVLLLGWSVLVLVFFSLSPGKREVYIFPALPALCLAAAPLLPGLLRKLGVQRVLAAYLAVLSGLATMASMAALAGWSDWARRLAAQREIPWSDERSLLLWLLTLGFAGCVLLAVFGARRIGNALVLFTCWLWATWGLGFMPAIDASGSARQIMDRAGQAIGPDAELGLIAWREQNLLQADRPVAEFGFKRPWHEQWREAGDWVRAAPRRRWLFVLGEALGPCVDRDRSLAIGQSNRRSWLLVPGTAVAGDCTTPPFPQDLPDRE
ncbi:ArnT family glycosyltransferase [Luteimonas marina]|uniref:ArnT family glycosyltransferase n=1 Tax=Luteimonas marina TaxID=488485 RepID=UPI003CCDCD75